jgi:hypothetical protein
MSNNKRLSATVRQAVCGTLNREVDVAVARQASGGWTVTMKLGRASSAPIRLEGWEMDAMRQVKLVPAHKRGIFLRHYSMLASSVEGGS